MSDTDRLYRLLKREGSRGVHTLDLRREGYSGNPSQRKADIEKKYGVSIHAERERRGDRNGSRYKLVGLGAGHTQTSSPGSRPGHLPPSVQSGQSSPAAISEPAPSQARSLQAQAAGDAARPLQEQRGVERRSIKAAQPFDAATKSTGYDGPVEREEPGGESGVPAAAPEALFEPTPESAITGRKAA